MAYCANCGNPLTDNQQFCPNCGQPVGVAPAQAPPPSPPAPPVVPAPGLPSAPPDASGQYRPLPGTAGYQQGWSYYPQSQQPPSPPRRSRTGMWIGIATAVVVIGVACGLVFGVFKDDIFGGAASSPEEAVRALLTAYEDRDVDAVFDLLDPESIPSLLQGQSEDVVRQMLRAAMFGSETVEFSGIELSTKETSDTTATVTITAGTVTITSDDGETETSDVKEADEPPTLDLVKRDGSWYIDADSMGLLGSDLDVGSGDIGATMTTTATAGDGTVSTGSVSITTTPGSGTTTPTTLSTSATGSARGGGGAATPEELVLKFFDAMQNKDMAAVFALFDPVTLEDMTGGVDFTDLMELMSEELFDYESVEFSGIKLSVDHTSSTTATVTVTEGEVTITDTDGHVDTMDVRDSTEPATVDVIQRDGRWYMDPYDMF
jgi:hypothetical protein